MDKALSFCCLGLLLPQPARFLLGLLALQLHISRSPRPCCPEDGLSVAVGPPLKLGSVSD